ncbi:MAG: DUF5711 family protein [Oscillospiraceae bacterium]|nr:DUF5711 family protein [Oscillospiraceae bacterium]
MTDNDKPKKNWQKIVGAVFSIISLIVLAYITIALIQGRTPTFSWFTDIFGGSAAIEVADELHFDVGRNRVFADMDGHIAAAGVLGVQVLDYMGNETLRENFRMDRPAIVTNGSRGIAFDIGGNAVRVFESGRVLSSFDTSGIIVSASINRNGWFTVNTQEGGGRRGMSTVFNDRGTAVFRANLASGYAFVSALSPDSRNLAVLNLTDAGSRIPRFLGMNQAEPSSVFVLDNTLIVDMHYLSNGNLLALSTQSLLVIDRGGEMRVIYEFDGHRLGGFILDDDIILLNLLDYGVGQSGRLLILNERGNIRAERPTTREIISMSYGGGFLAVMTGDGIEFFDTGLNVLPNTASGMSMAGINRVLALGGAVALAAGEHTVTAVRLGD